MSTSMIESSLDPGGTAFFLGGIARLLFWKLFNRSRGGRKAFPVSTERSRRIIPRSFVPGIILRCSNCLFFCTGSNETLNNVAFELRHVEYYNCNLGL